MKTCPFFPAVSFGLMKEVSSPGQQPQDVTQHAWELCPKPLPPSSVGSNSGLWGKNFGASQQVKGKVLHLSIIHLSISRLTQTGVAESGHHLNYLEYKFV